MHGEERHRVARVHQLVGLAQDDVRHRTENEQRDEDDNADRRVEKRPVQGKRAVETGIGKRIDAIAERAEPFKRGVGDGFVEHRPFLAGKVSATTYAKLGFKRRDEAPAVCGEFGREEIEMVRLAKSTLSTDFGS